MRSHPNTAALERLDQSYLGAILRYLARLYLTGPSSAGGHAINAAARIPGLALLGFRQRQRV
jgi:hypothetical protein